MKNTICDRPDGVPCESLYKRPYLDNPEEEDSIMRAGHLGGDYLITREFVRTIKEGRKPTRPFDVYSAVNMSSVAILGFRSMLEGRTLDIPDFEHDEEARKAYENDNATPFYGSDGSKPTLPCCSHPDYKPTERQLELFRELVVGDKK